jgi:hypothetical protein
MFHLCFSDACYKCIYLDVAYVSYICCIYLIWMFVYGCNCLQLFFRCFSSVLDLSFKCLNAFKRMSQLLYLDVSKVVRVLHLSSPPSATSSLSAPAGHPYDVTVGFFRIGDAVRLSPLVTWRRGPRMEREIECSARAFVRTSGR